MIPLRLQLEGVYSYKEKQEIDFTKLTSSGLFGIFGAVGSGKSTIPESMMLALYGNPERMKLQSNRSSLIHLLSEHLRIEFDFGLGKDNDQVYRAVFSLKRKKKNFDEIDKSEHTFYKKKGSTWEPLPHHDAKQILGMGLEDMRRTMIIPQGKFKEFIDLSAADRANMLQDLFGLDAYDLYEDTKRLKGKNFQQITLLKGELQGIGEVDEAIVSLKRKELEEHLKALNDLEENFKKVQDKLKSGEQELRLLQEKTQLQAQLDELNKEKANVEVLSQFINDYDLFVSKLKPVLDQLKEIVQRQDEHQKRLAATSIEKEKVEQLKREKEEDYMRFQQKMEGIPQKEDRIRQLEKVIERNQLINQLEAQQQLVSKISESIEEKEEEGRKIAQEITKVEESRERLKAQLPDQKKLFRINEAIQSLEAIEKGRSGLQTRIANLQKTINDLLSSQEEVERKWSIEEGESLESKEEVLKQQLQRLQGLSDTWNEQRTLHSFVHLVKEGEPCPLCGSTEHHVLPSAENEINPHQEELHFLREQLHACSGDVIKYAEYHKQIVQNQENLNVESELLKDIEERSKCELEFLKEEQLGTVADAKMKLAHFTGLADELVKIDSAKAGLDAKENARRKDLDILQTTFLRDSEKRTQLETRFKSIEESLELGGDAFWTAYKDKTPDEISTDMLKVRQFIDDTRKRHTAVTEELNDLKQKDASLGALIQEYNRQKVKDDAAFVEVSKALEEQRQELKWSLERESELHAFDGNIQDLRKKVQEFYISWNTAEKRSKELELILSTSTFTLEQFEAFKKQSTDLEEQLNQLRIVAGQLKEQKSLLEQRFARRQEVEKELEQLQLRDDRLSELERLFKGKGFVKFISGFYLEELCHSANKRFASLTKNRLSITLNDDLEFMVRDYLNGGRLRKLSTLSGGQTFQASLCLALALSERIKTIHQSDKSFFFLDEGFGSLDRESLSLVFESLKSLQSENRVVGIISHVEELKQEIAVGLQVQLDPERGSIVHF